MTDRRWIWLGIGFLIVIAAAVFVLPRIAPHQFTGALIQSNELAPDFTLTTQNGQPASLSDYRGKLVLLYFGYTFCPDVCPATLAEIKNALGLMGRHADQVQVIMITLDPERDTPPLLGQYLGHFSPDFVGMTGDLTEISQVAALYGIYFEKDPGSGATDYLVSHTASTMVIDADGYLKLVFPFGTTAADMAADMNYILR